MQWSGLIVSKKFYLLRYNAYSSLKVNRRLGRACRLHLQGRRVGQARNQRENKWRYIPEERTFLSYRCDNLKSYTDLKYTMFQKVGLFCHQV
jgi:hypothetical protein